MRRMQGYSITELMVAMSLGLLISAAAIQILISNQVSINFQRGMNDIQANGRFAVDQMVRDVRVAGLEGSSFDAMDNTPIAPIAFAAGDIPLTPPPPGCAAFSGNDCAGSGIGMSDQLVVQYAALTNTVDCEGNAVPAGRIVVARYFIRPDPANNNVPSLACDSGSHSGPTPKPPLPPMQWQPGSVYGDAGVVLLNGVDSFQVLYGVDDGNNKNPQVSRYMNTQGYMALVPKRPTILAVRLGLYLRSQESAGDVKPPTNNVQVLDRLIMPGEVPTDRLLRRLFITTVGLRNLDQAGV